MKISDSALNGALASAATTARQLKRAMGRKVVFAKTMETVLAGPVSQYQTAQQSLASVLPAIDEAMMPYLTEWLARRHLRVGGPVRITLSLREGPALVEGMLSAIALSGDWERDGDSAVLLELSDARMNVDVLGARVAHVVSLERGSVEDMAELRAKLDKAEGVARPLAGYYFSKYVRGIKGVAGVVQVRVPIRHLDHHLPKVLLA